MNSLGMNIFRWKFSTALTFVEPNVFMASIDLKDVYYSVSICPRFPYVLEILDRFRKGK